MLRSMEYPIFSWELEKQYNKFWDHNPIQEQMFRIELARHPTFANCFNPSLNLTQPFIDDIIRRTKGSIPLSLVIQIFGAQGDGKTKLGFEVAKLIDPRFNAKKVFMRIEAILNACARAKKNDCLQLDEQKIEFGEGSLRQLKDLQNVEEVTRIKQVHFICCSPTLREHLACHYTLKILQKNIEYRVTKFAFCSKDGKTYYGWGLANIPKDEDCKIWEEYEPKKLEFAQKTLERSVQKYDLWGKAKELAAHKLANFAYKKGEFYVLCQDLWPTLTIGEHSKIINAMALLTRREALIKE